MSDTTLTAPPPRPALTGRREQLMEVWRSKGLDIVAYAVIDDAFTALLDTGSQANEQIARWRTRYLFDNGLEHGQVNGPLAACASFDKIAAAGGVVLGARPAVPAGYTRHY